MKEIPLSSLTYFALCELSDASDNLQSLLSRLDSDSAKSLISDISSDVDNAINKLRKFLFNYDK